LLVVEVVVALAILALAGQHGPYDIMSLGPEGREGGAKP